MKQLSLFSFIYTSILDLQLQFEFVENDSISAKIFGANA
jgi:hypothetical protein